MKKTVLVADDQLGLLTGLIAELKEKYDVLTASSGNEAVEVLGKNSVDFAVLDNYMDPGPEGVEIAKQLQLEKPYLPVVVYTGSAGASFVMEEDGVKMCHKPSGQEALVAYINQMLCGGVK